MLEGGNRRGAGIEKSGAFEGAEGQSLGTGAGKISARCFVFFSFFFLRFIPADKDRPSPGRKSPPSWEHHPDWMLSFVLLLSATFVWSSPKLDVVLTRLRRFSTSFPPPDWCGWQRWARCVVDSLAEVCVAA